MATGQPQESSAEQESSADKQPSSGEPTPKRLSHAEIRTIIFGIMLAMLLAALDQTILATAMPTMGRELGDVEHLPWIVTSYLLASTAVTPLYGKLSDIHGRRVILMVGIVTFIIGSVACALAPNMLVLILARGLQGLGGGGLISLAQTIIADIVSPRERGRYQVYIASVFVSANVVGPALGGFLAESLHWSVIFWINVPLGFLALWMTNRSLKGLPRHERPHRLDILGALLMASGSVSFMLALSWGGLRYAWGSWEILGLIGIAALLAALFGLRLVTAREPLIPLTILKNPVVASATSSALFAMGTLIGLTIYMPLYYQVILGMTARDSGIALTPLMVGTVIGATSAGRAMASVTHYKRMPLAGLTISVAAMVTLFIVPRGLPFWVFEILMGATSIGLGTALPVTTIAIQNAVLPYQMGTATAAMNFFRQLGGAVIVAGFGAIVLGSEASHHGVALETLSESARNADVLTGAFRWVFAAAAAGLGLSLLSLILMEEKPLRTRRAGEGPAIAE